MGLVKVLGHFEGLHEVELAPKRERLLQIDGCEPVRGHLQRGSIDVVPVDAKYVRYASAAPLGQPGADSAADVEHRGRPEEFVDQRDDGLCRLPRTTR